MSLEAVMEAMRIISDGTRARVRPQPSTQNPNQKNDLPALLMCPLPPGLPGV